MNIEGLGALVVGGSSGLGAATAELLRERGANVAIADLKPPPEDAGLPFFETDVQDEEKVKAAVEGAVEALGLFRSCLALSARAAHRTPAILAPGGLVERLERLELAALGARAHGRVGAHGLALRFAARRARFALAASMRSTS